MPIRIEYMTRDKRQIELNADGSIDFHTDEHGRFMLGAQLAAMLKAMILAEAELNRQAQR